MIQKDSPLVTIQCLTYNHEPYIRQCLEGFVMQQTDFCFEVIVHDDASTDGTANIIREYAEKYPNIGEFYQFNLSSCIRQQNSLTAQFVSFSLSNLANIFYPPQFLQ